MAPAIMPTLFPLVKVLFIAVVIVNTPPVKKKDPH
jgi:hypothetical protein